MDGVSEPASEMQRVRAEIAALKGGQIMTHPIDVHSFRPHGTPDRQHALVKVNAHRARLFRYGLRGIRMEEASHPKSRE